MSDQGQVRRIETTTPLWRLVAVASAFGSVAALGYYLNVVGHGEDFATVAVITLAFTISFWARKRPDRLERKFGPFNRIAIAIRDSQDDLRDWVYARPLLAGVVIAACYGIAVVAAKHLVMILMGTLWSPWLAAAAGLAVGAVVASPHTFTTLFHRLTGPHDT